jgi:hypothetical protein
VLGGCKKKERIRSSDPGLNQVPADAGVDHRYESFSFSTLRLNICSSIANLPVAKKEKKKKT